MKKSYLDTLYLYRQMFMNRIAEIKKQLSHEQVQCSHCDNNSGEELQKVLKSENDSLFTIDELINQYIKDHH